MMFFSEKAFGEHIIISYVQNYDYVMIVIILIHEQSHYLLYIIIIT